MVCACPLLWVSSAVTAGGERIDIIEWSEDPKAFIREALSPATVLEVEIDETEHRAKVTVSEDQQSLAIGRGGQNVRLAAKLTGWNIDIASTGGAETEATPEDASTPSEEADITPEEMPAEIVEEVKEEETVLPAEEELATNDENEAVVDAKESRDAS